MSRVVKRSASQAVISSPSRRGVALPPFVPPQLSQPVEKPPSGPQWLHEIKLDGYRMAARIDNGRVQLLTRTGLNWTHKYPSAATALANLDVQTAYLDGELCGVDAAGLPGFAQTQAATDGERGVQVVYYAFDVLHLDGWDVSTLALIERKAILEPLVSNKPGLQFSGHDTGDGELILKHAGKLGFEGVVSKTIDAPYAPGNRGLWRKAKALSRQEFVIVGWSDPEGSRPYLGALLLGYYADDRKLVGVIPHAHTRHISMVRSPSPVIFYPLCALPATARTGQSPQRCPILDHGGEAGAAGMGAKDSPGPSDSGFNSRISVSDWGAT
jgi:DNA ligase D-like protein (predicted ligase)